MPTEVFKLAGSTINRVTTQITLGRIVPHVRGGIPEMTFARRGVYLSAPPDAYANASVSYSLDGTVYFAGDVVSFYDHDEPGLGWVREYHCLGLLNRAQYITMTDSVSLTDTASYNVAPDDPNVIEARQGRSIGQIVTDVLTMAENAAALDAAGLGAYTSMGPPAVLPAATVSDLAALSVVWPGEVQVSGERILQAIEGVVQSRHPNHYMHVEPDGTIRFLDPRAFTPRTLQIGIEPRVGMPEYTRDWSQCYSRVLVRGNTRTQAVTVQTAPWPGSSSADGGLAEDFAHDGLTNAQAKAAWNASDYQQPGQPAGQAAGFAVLSGGTVGTISLANPGYGYGSAPAVSISGGGGSGATATTTLTSGSVSAITVTAHGSGYTTAPAVVVAPPGGITYDIGSAAPSGTTAVVVTSSNTHVNWPVDFWDQTAGHAMGVLILYSDTIPGVTQFWEARVVACTAMTPGGTSTLTIDNPLPSLAYNSYTLYGVGSGASVVWRKYLVTNPDIGASMVNYFPYPVAYRTPDGQAATLTSAPTGTVMLSAAGTDTPPFLYRPIPIVMDPTTSHVYFSKPTALAYSPDQKTPVPADNVQAFLAVQNGTLTAVYPPDSGGPVYAGTSYTVEGISRTKTITVLDWRDYSNTASMLTYVTEMHAALCNTVVEGTLPYYGYDPQWLTPGLALNVAAAYTTGLEAVATPVVSVDLIPDEAGAEGTWFTTVLHFSNRRAPYSASAYLRPSMTGMSALNLTEGFTGGGAAGAAGAAGENAERYQKQMGDQFGTAAKYNKKGEMTEEATPGQVGERYQKTNANAATAPAAGITAAMNNADVATTPDLSSIPRSAADLGVDSGEPVMTGPMPSAEKLAAGDKE